MAFKFDFLKRSAVKINRKESKFLGVHLPQDLYNYLMLESIVNQVTIASLVVGLLKVWKDKKVKYDKEEVLLEEIVVRVQYDYSQTIGKVENITKKDQDAMFEEYTKQLATALSNRGLENRQIKWILNRLKNE